MALEESRFFDSVGGDRKYPADEFAEYFREFLTTGIKNGGNNLKVTATGADMTVQVDYGFAMLQGYGFWLKDNGTSRWNGTITAAHASLPRIDRVVLRLDKSLGARLISTAVKTGTPAATPSPPTLTRSGNIYEISLAQVYVGPNAVKITTANITDERANTEVCGYINSLITVDTTEMLAEFEGFMDGLAAESPVLHTEVVDNLDSTDADKVLSAAQGKALMDLLDLLEPLGSVKAYPFSAAPNDHYALVQGQLLNRADYPALWALAETAAIADADWLAGYNGDTNYNRGHFSDGDGSTTFRMPDYQGRVLAGTQSGGSIDAFTTLGRVIGTQAHNHPLSSAGYAKIAVINVSSDNILADRIDVPSYATNRKLTGSSPGGSSAETTFGVALGGQTDAGSSVQPTVLVNYIMRVK